MAFMKYAKASVVHPFVTREEWRSVRASGRVARGGFFQGRTAKVDLASNLVDRVSELFERPFDPKDYLLSHATIVSSVDTESVPNCKTGRVLEKGFQVNRKWDDYYVTKETEKFGNHNNDCWERKVLLKAYPSFIGSWSFQEHVQIEDLNKGRIIDAVARDIGPSVYIDILVANERKHRELIGAIESGKMSTLSMGCTVSFTLCTQCGHLASDETEMCEHIRFRKGNTFIDRMGHSRKVMELCGHHTEEDGGVQFIEASWVETPAFTGAVLRNVLEPTVEISRKAKKILSSPPKEWSKEKRLKAAKFDSEGRMVMGSVSDRLSRVAEDEVMPEGISEAPEPKTPPLLQGLEDELTQSILEKVKKRLQESIKGPEDQRANPETSSSTNENVQKLANVYQGALKSIARTASSDVQMVDRIADFHQGIGFSIPVSVYRTALKVGALHKYGSQQEFLTSCRKNLGRDLTKVEVGALIRLGKLLSQVG